MIELNFSPKDLINVGYVEEAQGDARERNDCKNEKRLFRDRTIEQREGILSGIKRGKNQIGESSNHEEYEKENNR